MGVFTPSGWISSHPLATSRFTIHKDVPAAAASTGRVLPANVEPVQYHQTGTITPFISKLFGGV